MEGMARGLGMFIKLNEGKKTEKITSHLLIFLEEMILPNFP